VTATDVEIDRALNALSATLNDQPSADVGDERLQEIVDGATGQERKLDIRRLTPNSFALDEAEEGGHVASAERDGERWSVRREDTG
jgi:hypothetical protein